MSKSRTGFWPALERLAGGAVTVEWRGELGPDAEGAWPFLRPANRLASTYPCTNVLGCECPHRIEELSPGCWMAVPAADEGCAPIPLKREDLIVYEVDTAALCRGMAVCLNLDVCGSRTVAGARAERIGKYGPSGWGVYLMVPGDSARMMREVDRLFNAHPDPFVLLTPTGVHCSGDVESCLRRQLCMHIALRDIVDLGPDGKLTAKPSAGPLLAEFARRIDCRHVADAAQQGLRQHLDGRLDRVEQGVERIGTRVRDLEAENTLLKQHLVSALVRIARRVEPEFFQWVLMILGKGSVSGVARDLGLSGSTFDERLKRYADKGGLHRTLYSLVAVRRKGLGAKSVEGFNELFLGHQKSGENDESDILRRVLDGLEALNPSNFQSMVRELIELVQEYLPDA